MATPDNGLAAVVYAPSTVKARVGAAGQVTIRQVTDYPFSGVITLTVTPSVNRLRFPLQLRIPSWADGAAVTLNGAPVAGVTPGAFSGSSGCGTAWRPSASRCQCRAYLHLVSRLSGGRARSAGVLAAHRRGLAAYHGWHEEAGAAPAADWEVLPTTPWNYGLRIGRRRRDVARHRAGGGSNALRARHTAG